MIDTITHGLLSRSWSWWRCSGTTAQADTVALAIASSVDEVLTNIRNWPMGILAGLATAFLTIGGVRRVFGDGDTSGGGTSAGAVAGDGSNADSTNNAVPGNTGNSGDATNRSHTAGGNSGGVGDAGHGGTAHAVASAWHRAWSGTAV